MVTAIFFIVLNVGDLNLKKNRYNYRNRLVRIYESGEKFLPVKLIRVYKNCILRQTRSPVPFYDKMAPLIHCHKRPRRSVRISAISTDPPYYKSIITCQDYPFIMDRPDLGTDSRSNYSRPLLSPYPCIPNSPIYPDK